MPVKSILEDHVWLAGGLVFFLALTGCAELQDQREHGSITSAGFSEATGRMENIDMAYVRNWVESHGTTPEELLGKTPPEVQSLLGRPRHKVTRADMCGPNPRRDASVAQHPENKPYADASDKYWCQEDHLQFSYNIPRWFYVNGNTFCEIVFEDGKVKSVGNLTARFPQ
jgi:hypothetical protein